LEVIETANYGYESEEEDEAATSSNKTARIGRQNPTQFSTYLAYTYYSTYSWPTSTQKITSRPVSQKVNHSVPTNQQKKIK